MEVTVRKAEAIARACVRYDRPDHNARDRRLDRLLTGRVTGIPLMLLLLLGVFWLTISGANYPSALLSEALFKVQDYLTALFTYLGAPEWLHGLLVLGAYRTLAWVVSVMLPPMAIFFPLFTLLEDFGYLPRIAFVLDHAFQKAHACGKQALTMWMVEMGKQFKHGQAQPTITMDAPALLLASTGFVWHKSVLAGVEPLQPPTKEEEVNGENRKADNPVKPGGHGTFEIPHGKVKVVAVRLSAEPDTRLCAQGVPAGSVFRSDGAAE